MGHLSNEAIVKLMFKNAAEKNIPATISAFDKDVVWVRPGEPDIPFSGTFPGIDGMINMLTLIQQSIKLKEFIPEQYCSNDDTVLVMGHDEAEVIATGKTYHTEWVQLFRFRNEKIYHVHVYMDTLAVARAFKP